MSDDDLDYVPRTQAERHALVWALILNVGLASALATAGLVADSSALIANALDNASDAAVYGISLFAVSHGKRWKIRAARVSGVMLLVVAAGVIADVVRRFIEGPEPVGPVIIGMAIVAAVVNLLCLRLLRASRKDDVNLRAAWTFSINDLVSNLGVLAAGALVYWLGRAWPDLVVGFAIAAVAAMGGIGILRDARCSSREPGAG